MKCEPGSLGRALHLLRSARGLSITKLAETSGVEKAKICDYEHGNQSPGFSNLSKLVRAMGFRLGAIDHAQEFDLGLEEVEIGEGRREAAS